MDLWMCGNDVKCDIDELDGMIFLWEDKFEELYDEVLELNDIFLEILKKDDVYINFFVENFIMLVDLIKWLIK